MDHKVVHGYVNEEIKDPEQVQYPSTWMILASIFMIVPIFNIIFGAIGLKKYPKNVHACKTKRTVCKVAFIFGVVEMIIVAIAGLIEALKQMANGS